MHEHKEIACNDNKLGDRIGGRKSNSSFVCTNSKMKSLYRANLGKEALSHRLQLFSDIRKDFLLA